MGSHNDLISTSISVHKHIRAFSQFRKHLPVQKLSMFALDLSLVAFSVRTGYLVDLFSPDDPVDLFSKLLIQLRADQTIGQKFSSIVHVYEPSSEQSFFVNNLLLSQRISSYSKTAFIHLVNPFKILEDPPEDVQRLTKSLDQLTKASEIPVSFSLSGDSPVEALVPFAAILLDYPAAYVPSSSHDNGLASIPLDFYECLLTISPTRGDSVQDTKDAQAAEDFTHTIMKFSCPAVLKEELCKHYGDEMKKTLLQMFLERLERIGEPALQVRVEHSTQTLNHVAF